MSWDTNFVTITVSVDNGGGDLQRRGEELHAEFGARLQALCGEYNSDAFKAVHCG